jgi:hypothetical protein
VSQPPPLSVAEERSAVLATLIPRDYRSTPGRDRQVVAQLYAALYGKDPGTETEDVTW